VSFFSEVDKREISPERLAICNHFEDDSPPPTTLKKTKVEARRFREIRLWCESVLSCLLSPVLLVQHGGLLIALRMLGHLDAILNLSD
jgi:glutathione S-transferase